MDTKKIILLSTILGFTAVILGALGAHALKSVLSEQALDSYLTGVRYQMYHALFLLGVAAVQQHLDPLWMNRGVWLALIGVILFSGSIYLLSTREITALTHIGFLGPITPIGGLLLISSWISIGIASSKKS
jgi:uncharacterized membrane protein YgdD (TMEM256/DUF423 family)